MLGLVSDVDGILVGIDPITERVMKAAPRLKAISKYGAGLDNVDLEAAKRLGIAVSTAPGTNAVSVAELTIGFLFDLSRHITQSVTTVKSGVWGRVVGTELTGKTLGLIGCGNIGREVAKRARGLEMNMLVYDPYFCDQRFLDQYQIQLADQETILSKADYLSLHLPLTEETQGMMGRPQFEMMKKTAFLINTSRGLLVREEDLVWALKNKIVAGAAMDVFWREPARDHELLHMDNFLLTPHMAANTVEAVLKMARVATENLVSMLSVTQPNNGLNQA